MAHPADVARGRNIVARWCNLAEQRLEYLTELFETGRWRRFHTEREFLENIREAKAAVATWRDLLSREAALDNTQIDLAWLGRRRTLPLPLTPLPRDEGYRQPVVHLQPQPVVQLQPQPAPIAPTPPRDVPADVLVALESQLAVVDAAPSVADPLALDEISFPALDLDAMKERYPLLRNAL
ncbi:TIGR03809 family protein [Bradyrhizobium paxllaeri]|uniref:TIGR03809 family protein n=1 Tax=Bradyrhizobium paxllaeri TaxID=190148 RepID=UPI0008105E2D|nr:TIGR03809 family protein [Bradyrhizobium paxllaeri]